MTTPPPARTSRPFWRSALYFIVAALVLLLVLLLALGFYMSWRFDDPLPPDLESIQMLEVRTPDGQLETLGESLKPGVPTVISLWASWCGPCVSEAPKIAELRRQFPEDQLNMVYLNVREQGASTATLDGFVSGMGLGEVGYLILNSDEDLAKVTNDSAKSIPRTLVFDESGSPVAAVIGYKPLALDRIASLVD